MAEEKKNMTTGNENTDEKKEQNNPSTEDKTEKIGFFKKIGNGFKENKKKIGVGIGIAAAFAAGIAADKIGIKFPKKPEGNEETEAE